MDVPEIPDDIRDAAEKALDKMLCNCSESCGGYDGLRRASIEDIARALLAQDKAATERAAKIAEEFRDSNPIPTVYGAIAAAIRQP